jgi:flagellin
MSEVTLSAGVRQNLLSLQRTADMMSTTQNRLATGKRVTSALDNPTNFFTSASLQSRSKDLGNLLDAMSNGIKTLEAADNGLKAITKTVESMQSTLRQARQDKSFKSESFEVGAAVGTVTLQGGAVGASTTVGPQVNGGGAFAPIAGSFTIQSAGLNGGATVSVTTATTDTVDQVVGKINAALDGATGGDAGIVAKNDGGSVKITSTYGDAFTVTDVTAGAAAGVGLTAGASTAATSATVDELVTVLNNNAGTKGDVRATNDNGKLRIENLSTSDLSATVGTATKTIGGNDVRKNLSKQFNELRDQLDKLSDDASFNGINLLRADKLKITFNETGTSTIDIQAKDTSGKERAINSSNLNIESVVAANFDSDATIDSKLGKLGDALNTLRSQSSAFGSNLSAVQNRVDFTKSMMNTLQTGADKLVLADSNEEAANMLALQTRQQLSNTALSLASQADQGVLRLF